MTDTDAISAQRNTLIPRREILRIGALSIAAPLIGGQTSGWAAKARRSQRNCIFIMLQGGPSHHELWDPKPNASEEIRGPFGTTGTTIPGIRFGLLAERTAMVTEHLAIVRSMTHKFTNHIAGAYITMTGSSNQPDRDREAHADDFPGPGAILNRLGFGESGIPASVSLPNWLSIPGPSNRMPGQYGGFLGSVCDPFLVAGDPSAKQFKPLALALPEGMTGGRLGNRLSLLDQLDRAARRLEAERTVTDQHSRLRASAFQLVTDGRVRRALDLSNESPAIRDRYGRNKLGQSLLLARRLAEAGVRWVSYNEFNQKWDTHGNLAPRYRDIVPALDQAYSTLIDDLAQRGQLDSTLVACGGEFGRTPVVNKGGGRDHWPNAYSFLLAGGGVRGGQVLGATDAVGGEVLHRPTAPADVLATIWRQLGVDCRMEIRDRLQRPFPISSGSPIDELV